jgi:hypothetical protein
MVISSSWLFVFRVLLLVKIIAYLFMFIVVKRLYVAADCATVVYHRHVIYIFKLVACRKLVHLCHLMWLIGV